METTIIGLDLSWLLSMLIALIAGSYAWTTGCVAWLSKKIDTLKYNHFTHIDLHLRNKCDDDCAYCQERE